jgi:alpha-1,2-mannosyltransferase
VNRSRLLAGATLVVTVILGAQTWSKAVRPGGNDLTSYLLSARALWDGQSPYGLETPFPYIYPLFLAFSVIPLIALPYGAAVIGWFMASVGALGGVLRRCAAGSDLAALAAVAVTFSSIQNTLLNGQVNFFVVLCCVFAIVAARARRVTAAGVWLGVGTAIKLMPALLVVYLLVRRQFRAAAVAAATAVALSVVPGLLIDGSLIDVYSQFARELQGSVATVPAGGVLAFSISGVVQQVSGAGPSLVLDVLCAAAVLGTIAVVDVQVWRPRGEDFTAGAAYMAGIVLVSPKSETHHLVFIIPAVALGFAWFFRDRSHRTRLGTLALVLSSAALVAAPLMGAAEGPAIAAAVVLLVAALAVESTE